MRKTAAICVAKLYDTSPAHVEERGFLDMLRDLLADSNPTVVANAIAALNEIQVFFPTLEAALTNDYVWHTNSETLSPAGSEWKGRDDDDNGGAAEAAGGVK